MTGLPENRIARDYALCRVGREEDRASVRAICSKRGTLHNIRTGIQLDLLDAVAFGGKRALQASFGRR